jgi:hypothetical protein
MPLLGNTALLHHPTRDVIDDAIPFGVSYWVSLAESLLKPEEI